MGFAEIERMATFIFKAVLLPIACLYMAGLNLWLLFKDWFKERYARKGDAMKQDKRVGRVGESKGDERNIPSFVGKSKWNEEQQKRKQDQLEQEVKNLKDKLDEVTKNQSILSIPLEAIPKEQDAEHQNSYDQPVSSEEEIILDTTYDKSDVELSGNQSFTMDEFEMVAKSLKGNPVSKDEEKQVAEIIPRIKGTDMFRQFIGQVNGAEEKALQILKFAEAISQGYYMSYY
ncbi:hypothetical protein CLV62_12822 [Dysgonomonas alginatilytica]|uniref:Uncharacterized protein n=1 Tax=Dysgonomonas alginatilytica TaxID=1605892 RepID=A0A2V3PJF0_9BACT|nr:hypothetical protein [Dysgonomonas alginatilytica]PXV60935.1 hypothetical protein CLV62_12822 [Dysgonomonas alginatilytica]